MVHYQEILENTEPEDLPRTKLLPELSSQSEFVASNGLSSRYSIFCYFNFLVKELSSLRHYSAWISDLILTNNDRADEGCWNTVSADDCGIEIPETQNNDVSQPHSIQDAITSSQLEEPHSDFPPSFASFLMSCCPADGKGMLYDFPDYGVLWMT